MKNIKLDVLPAYNDRYIKCKIRAYGHNVYTNFCCINMPEDGVESDFLTTISNDSLLVYEKKCYLQISSDSCAYIIANKEIINYLDDNLFESDQFFPVLR